MALSAEQTQRIFDMLAVGKTAQETADDIGCSRATIQRLKKKSKNDPLLRTAQTIAAEKRLNEESDRLLVTLATMKEREPQIQEGLWVMFDGLSGLFSQVLAQTDAADISPRQLPALAKAAADIAGAYCDFADRVNGLDVLASEIKKLDSVRPTEAA